MTEPESLRVFINEQPYIAAIGSTLLELLDQQMAEEASALRNGLRRATDGVGRPITGDYELRQGEVIRLIGSGKESAAD